MCGIVGYVGSKDIETVLIVGLERLSYRGYDSAGIAVIDNDELSYWKRPGKIYNLQKVLQPLNVKGEIGIGHTRWATHGEPNESNAHPHVSQNKKFAVVHNGIIENFAQIRLNLQKDGYFFRSDTDTEVISHLIEKNFGNTGNLVAAVERTVEDLVGTYAIGVISEQEPDKIVVCRKGSPLIIGIGQDENYISSDINAIISHTKQVMYLEDNELAEVTKSGVKVKALGGGEIQKSIQTITWDSMASEKAGYDHFMQKEIFEQPTIVRNIISKLVTPDNDIQFKHLRMGNQALANINRFIIQACGTSWHAGLIGKYLFERYARVLTEVDISSEFRYRQMITGGNEAVVAISQSGETADTLACIREAKSKFFKVLSFVNVKGSTIDRESDGVVYSYAGQEVGVASTKNYIAQLVTIYLFSIYLGVLKWGVSKEQAAEMITELKKVPDYIESILGQADAIKKLADKYAKSSQFIFIGRGVNYPTALEGALKLKEISYIHATGYPAGELKHGPIALIDKDLPVVCLAPQSDTYEKMVSNIQEVRARKGRTIVIASEGDSTIKEYAEDVIYIPKVSEDLSPILSVVPLQLLAYYISIQLGCDVDQPRNLAKSVTVE